VAASKFIATATARYSRVEKLLAERNSQRSIVRVTGVARMTVAKLAKKSAAQALENA
jgi:DNA invertase Pin-like site-specific DNA recombinase